MKGHFYKPHCKCTTKKCKCSATWSYMIDVGINPATGKRKQKKKVVSLQKLKQNYMQLIS